MLQTISCVPRLITVACLLIVSHALLAHQALAQTAQSQRFTTTVLAIKEAEPAVVNIEGNKPASSASASYSAEPPQVNGMGSGVIIDPRGYILTNQHVVQDVSRIEVTLHDGSKHLGKSIDHDPDTDLALIKIDAHRSLPTIAFGTSSDLLRGELVIAIGNPFGYQHTVTEGIISALHRNIPVNGAQEYRDLIQTDASINPGNSGGPLLNAEGKMIGINAAVRVGAQGIGFAIPVDKAIEVAAGIIAAHRKTAMDDLLSVETIFKDSSSYVRVAQVSKSGKFTSGDLREGDTLTSVGGTKINNRLEYEFALADVSPDRSVEMHYTRNGTSGVASVSLKPVTRMVSTVSATSKGIEERVWRQFGLRLQTADPARVQQTDPSYKGGMRVIEVREQSPAQAALIHSGDILVGLLEWQTPNWDDLVWIVNSPEMKQASSPDFHILRGKGVYYGKLEVGKKQLR